MGLFDLIFRPKENKKSEKVLNNSYKFFEIGDYKTVFTTAYGEIYENLLVRAAIDARARHISKLKVDVVGSAKQTLQNKLKTGPNQWQTWSQFLYRISTILDIHNTAFIVPVFDEYMRISGYYPILPNRAEIIEYKEVLYLRYKFNHGETAAVELAECATLTKYQYKSDFFGEKSHALDDTIKLLKLQAKGIEEAVKNTTSYKFYAQLDNFSIEDDLKNERKQFTELNLKADQDASGLLLFPNTYRDIHQIQQASYNVDAKELELINQNVFFYFGVNEAILTNSADSTQLDAFFNGCIEPFSVQLAESFTKAVFTERERQNKNHVIVHANRLQYMSTTEKTTLARELGDRGILTINEIRELFNYNMIDGGDVAPIRGEYKSTLSLSKNSTEETKETEETEETNEKITETEEAITET